MVTNEVHFLVCMPVDYTCNSLLSGLIVGIAQLAYAACESIFCHEVWRSAKDFGDDLLSKVKDFSRSQ